MRLWVDGVEHDAEPQKGGGWVFIDGFVLPKGDHVVTYNFREYEAYWDDKED